MSTLYVKTHEGEEKDISAQDGLSIMEILPDNGFDQLLALCGGCCSCATCHVYVKEPSPELPPMSDDENDLLDSSSHRQTNSRLPCQLPWSGSLDGLHVTIAPAD